jgi:hypothetical protein
MCWRELARRVGDALSLPPLRLLLDDLALLLGCLVLRDLAVRALLLKLLDLAHASLGAQLLALVLLVDLLGDPDREAERCCGQQEKLFQ